MRVKIRNRLNVDKPVNLKRLDPYMKVYAGIMAKYHSSEFYRKKLNKKLEESAIRQMQNDDTLKNAILAQIYRELELNKTLQSDEKLCSGVTISVDPVQKNALDRILRHRDFLPYGIERIPENADIRLAFYDMPYMIRVRKRTV
jgi:hypothetical protein